MATNVRGIGWRRVVFGEKHNNSSKCVKIIYSGVPSVYVLQVVRHVEINCKIDTLLNTGYTCHVDLYICTHSST